MSEQQKDLFVVQRKVIAWEEQTVEASSFDEAKAIAQSEENIYNWDYKSDTSEITDDYWVMNEYTGEERIY